MTKRRGRRPKRLGDTRSKILTAAGVVLGRTGLGRATLRSVAREADVDPALILHYFGSRDALFFEVLRESVEGLIRGVLADASASADPGRTIVEAFVRRWDSEEARATFAGLLLSAASDARVARMLREFFGSRVLTMVARELSSSDPGFRAGLVASHLLGLGVVRYVVRLGPVVGATPETLGAAVGPSLTRYLTGTLTDLPTGRRSSPARGPARRGEVPQGPEGMKGGRRA